MTGMCQFQRTHRQIGRGLGRRTHCLCGRPVKVGQRRGVARMRGFEQVAGNQDRRFPAVQQDLAVLAMQRLTRWPWGHVADSAAQEFVPE